MPGRDIMVQAWYQGGVSVFDFTDSANPVEIAFFDRGPINAKELVTGGYWSSYWYNGNIYGAEIARGIDVFRLLPSELPEQNEIDAAKLVRFEEFNSQHQPRYVWPPSFVVAKAYLDQLARGKTIDPARAKALRDRARPRRHPRRAQRRQPDELDGWPRELETDAAVPGRADASPHTGAWRRRSRRAPRACARNSRSG